VNVGACFLVDSTGRAQSVRNNSWGISGGYSGRGPLMDHLSNLEAVREREFSHCVFNDVPFYHIHGTGIPLEFLVEVFVVGR